MKGDPAERYGVLAMVLAAGLAALAFVAAGIAGKTFPFGSAPRSTSDMGRQNVPLYAHLRDLLHGEGGGDVFFNWQSGFGVPFLPDFGIYLSSPFSLLVAVFPRDRVDLAVYVITVLKLAAAAAAMTFYLVRLRPGPVWLAGILGASYGLCGWAIDEASYLPMWLDGLIAFPLFCLVGEWSMRGRRMLPGIAVVAVFWFANFYIAFMATIGAGVVLLVRLLTTDLRWLERLKAVARHAATTTTGIALTAPVLLPVIKANASAQPAPPGEFKPIATDLFLSRLLPMSEGIGAGARIFVGTAALLLAVTLPLNNAVPARTRVLWTTAAVLLALSFQWGPTHVMWHGFDAPNGNPFRQAFVLCGVLVIAGWVSVTHRVPGPPAIAGAVVALAALAFGVRDSHWLNPRSVTVFAVSAALVGVAVLGMRSRWVMPITALILVAVVVVEGSATAVQVHRDRSRYLGTTPVWQDGHSAVRRAVTEADGWPKYRTDPGTDITANDPLLLGGQGGGYYSSVLPADVHRTLDDLGFRWAGWGRSMVRLDNPVTDAVFSIRRDGTTLVPPLVTVRPGPMTARGDTVFARHEALLGSRLYETPPYRITPLEKRLFRVEARCRPGSTVYLYTPATYGVARLANGDQVPLWSSRRRPGVDGRGGIAEMGRVSPTGKVVMYLRLSGDSGGLPRTGALACLDHAKLEGAINHLRQTGATEVKVGGHSIEATLPRPMTGIAVIAVPKLPGWECAGRQPVDFGGLLAVPLTEPTTRVSCRYRPPGLQQGLVIAGVAAMVTLGCATQAIKGVRS